MEIPCINKVILSYLWSLWECFVKILYVSTIYMGDTRACVVNLREREKKCGGEQGLAYTIQEMIRDLLDHDRVQLYISSSCLRNSHTSAHVSVSQWRDPLGASRQILDNISRLLNSKEWLTLVCVGWYLRGIYGRDETTLTTGKICSPPRVYNSNSWHYIWVHSRAHHPYGTNVQERMRKSIAGVIAERYVM